jgi:hypothetical protein
MVFFTPLAQATRAMVESAEWKGGDESRTRSKRVAFDLVIKRLQKTLAGNVIRHLVLAQRMILQKPRECEGQHHDAGR